MIIVIIYDKAQLEFTARKKIGARADLITGGETYMKIQLEIDEKTFTQMIQSQLVTANHLRSLSPEANRLLRELYSQNFLSSVTVSKVRADS